MDMGGNIVEDTLYSALQPVPGKAIMVNFNPSSAPIYFSTYQSITLFNIGEEPISDLTAIVNSDLLGGKSWDASLMPGDQYYLHWMPIADVDDTASGLESTLKIYATGLDTISKSGTFEIFPLPNRTLENVFDKISMVSNQPSILKTSAVISENSNAFLTVGLVDFLTRLQGELGNIDSLSATLYSQLDSNPKSINIYIGHPSEMHEIGDNATLSNESEIVMKMVSKSKYLSDIVIAVGSQADLRNFNKYIFQNADRSFWSMIDTTEVRYSGVAVEKVGDAECQELSARNYPNPGNPITNIEYTIDRAGKTRIGIFDISGRLVKKVVDMTQNPGTYRAQWDGKDQNGKEVASGVYIYQLENDRRIIKNRLTLLK
jgi:hypothetical protein